ncbi:MAG: hypothetical protein QOJ00_1242 [Actinomycetota bacterium]
MVVLAACVALFGAGAACGGGGADAEKSVVHTVRASIQAENAKNADAFLRLWTDRGLARYDSGTRNEIANGTADGFGQDRVDILKVVRTTLSEGNKASVRVDAAPRDFHVARVVYRVQFDLIKRKGRWLIDGFAFNGSPSAIAGAEIVDIKAQEYSFALSKPTTGSDVGFTFENVGKEQHELTLFKAPDATTLDVALAAVENVDGDTLQNLPAGYTADHLSFADLGQKLRVSFAQPLAKGTYVMACFLPQGGFGKNGPNNPNGKPHVQLGMINLLTVA